MARVKVGSGATIDIGFDPLMVPPPDADPVAPDAEGRVPFHQHATNKQTERWAVAGAAQLHGWGIGRVVSEEEFDAAVAAYKNIPISG